MALRSGDAAQSKRNASLSRLERAFETAITVKQHPVTQLRSSL